VFTFTENVAKYLKGKMTPEVHIFEKEWELLDYLNTLVDRNQIVVGYNFSYWHRNQRILKQNTDSNYWEILGYVDKAISVPRVDYGLGSR